MVEKYNNKYHRLIKLTLSDARNPANYQHIHNVSYAKARKDNSPKFHVNDKVRIPRQKGTHEKAFTTNWTEEVYTMANVKATYTIMDALGEPVQGTFYEHDLQSSVQNAYKGCTLVQGWYPLLLLLLILDSLYDIITCCRDPIQKVASNVPFQCDIYSVSQMTIER